VILMDVVLISNCSLGYRLHAMVSAILSNCPL
jgi:hypothetical protein